MVEVALAAAALKAVLGAVTKSLVAEAFKFHAKRSELRKGFPNDMNNLQIELRMFQADVEDQIAGKGDPCAVKRVSIKAMCDLAYDVEDYLDRVLRCTEGGNKKPSLQLAQEAKELVERVKQTHQQNNNHKVNGTQVSPATPPTAVVLPQPQWWSSSAPAVGIDEPKNQIVDLLLTKDADEGQSKQLKVISIVGFGGSGKTTLAKKVYDHFKLRLKDQFPCRAWVEASKHGDDIKSFLTELLGNICPGEEAGEDVEQRRTKISEYLNKTRYLIVLDDFKKETWWNDCLKSTLSNNTGSRIIVTTTIQTVANVCSRENGYVHNMKTLDDKHSKELLKSVLREHSYCLEQSSTSIVNKCDGHPLSLDAVARYLTREDAVTKVVCDMLSNILGHCVATEDAFWKLREVLMDNYTSLPGNLPNIKACLMYMCVFPNGCHIKRTRLTRRWLAEHYVQHVHPRTSQEVADGYFEKLVDRNLISPMDASKKRRVKSWRAHGIMHEFIRHMSKSANFITSLDDPDRRDYRHLFINEGLHSTSSGRSSTHGSKKKEKEKEKEENKLRAHSLTICGNAGEVVREFLNCELLRVLDLEECDDLEDKDIDGIHDLWHLRYLSLGAKVSKLPREIEKLYCLETLDVRKTKKEITLPSVVIKLPHLAHLLGKFKLEKESNVEKYVPEEGNNLQTLAGFVTDDDPRLPTLMAGMKKLQKVKAWCNSDKKGLFLDAIQKFVKTGFDTPDCYRSLSLCLVNSTSHFPGSLQSSLMENPDAIGGHLSSLKIRGALGELDSVIQLTRLLSGLRVLCLSSTIDLAIKNNDLSSLGGLTCLEYLRLVKVSLGGLVIETDHFPGLLCLCLVQSPTLPKVKNGALQRLLSLQLLAEDLTNPPGIKIEQHKLLQEVVLDSKVNEETKEFWKDAAQKHPKRPRVLYLDRVDPDGTGSIVKYVATKRPAAQNNPKRPRDGVLSLNRVDPDEMMSTAKYVAAKRLALFETRSSIVQEEQQIPESLVSAELCSPMDIEMPSSS